MKNLKINIIIFSIVTLVLTAAATGWAEEPQQIRTMSEYMAGQDGMEWMMLAFWGIVLGILILAVQWVSNLLKAETEKRRSLKTAMDILNDRFAVGEINAGEFETRKRILLE